MVTLARTLSSLWFVAAVGFATVSAPSTAVAQTPAFGYVFYGPVLVDNFGTRDSKTAWHFGAGGEMRITPKVGIGAELGSIYFPLAEMQLGCCGHARAPAYRGGILSLNGTFHFTHANSSQRAQPFITGGYALLFDGFEMWNIGGGMNWWATRRVGLRVEIREHFRDSPFLFGFRAGVVFR